jgi:hypothetical protein
LGWREGLEMEGMSEEEGELVLIEEVRWRRMDFVGV